MNPEPKFRLIGDDEGPMDKREVRLVRLACVVMGTGVLFEMAANLSASSGTRKAGLWIAGFLILAGTCLYVFTKLGKYGPSE